MTEKKIILFILLFLFTTLIIVAAFSEGSGYGGGDSSMHMLISKFSFKHPELFLHHWGKPFFILFSAPFAQFGFFGMSVFNILCALTAAYLMYLLAMKFKFENSWMALFLSLLAPVYFVVIFSGLTEVFFSFILVLSIFLFTKEKYFLSPVIASFLPFIRTEGYLLLPLVALALIYKRKTGAIPLLAAGTIIYSLIGGIYFGDFFWIVHRNPYGREAGIYGSGSLFYFINQNEFILGTALVALLILGTVSLFIRRRGKEILFNKVTNDEVLLIYGCFGIYFLVHSICWWKGWFGSDGLIRVMAAITPLIALPALRGVNMILSFNSSTIIKIIILMAVVMMPFKQHTFPKRFDYEEATLHKAGIWIEQNNLALNKIICSHPFVVYELGKDPFDKNSVSDFFSLKSGAPEESVASGELVIWDSHFGPNEGRIPLQKLTGNKNFKLLNSFGSDMLVTPEDKGKFEVYVFQRV